MADWEPPAELTRLLEALAGEVVSSTEPDIQLASTPTAADARATVALLFRMREMIGDAIDEPAERKERLVLLALEAVGELRQRPN